MYKNWINLKYLLITVFFVFPIFSHAQIKSFSVRQSPENVNPGETIIFNLSSASFNIDLAKVSWIIDKKIVDSGMGKKTFTTTAPANGKTISLEIEVTPQGDNAPLRQFFNISPADIDVLWQAVDSYTPPFYKGKALPISQSQMKIVAIPVVKSSSGSYIKPENFVYSWKKDLKNFPAQGGLGKNSFVFNNEILEKQNLINIAATDGIRNVSGGVVVNFFTPEILFYEINGKTLLPKYSQTLASSTKSARLNITAEPYFVSKNFKTNPDIITKWKINDQEIKADENLKNFIAINTSGTTGNISINFSYEDIRKLFRRFNFSQNVSISR